MIGRTSMFAVLPRVGTNRAAIAPLVLSVALAGCREEAAPTHPRAAVTPASRTTVVGVNDAWDSFAADVTVENVFLDSTGRVALRQHPVAYHLERQLKGGYWTLVMTFASRARAIVANPGPDFAPESYEPTRFEDDGDGSPPRVYDGLGRLISLQPPPLPDALGNRRSSAMAAAAQSAIGTARALMSATAAHPASTDQRWAAFYVITPDGQPARAASLVRQFGPPTRSTRGTDEYVLHRDSVTVTIESDPVLAAITEIVERVGNAVRRHWTIDYEKSPDGTAKKTGIRVESLAADRSRHSRITTTRIANIRFERRAGS